MRRVMLFFGLCLVCLFSSQTVYADRVHVHSGGHYLEWNGNTFIPVGDSVTQGWFESGADFNHKKYIDALAGRNMNVVMLWSFMGASAQTQAWDERFNYRDKKTGRPLAPPYDPKEVWPWKKENGQFNLNRLNQAYFDRLKEFVDYADKKTWLSLSLFLMDG